MVIYMLRQSFSAFTLFVFLWLSQVRQSLSQQLIPLDGFQDDQETKLFLPVALENEGQTMIGEGMKLLLETMAGSYYYSTRSVTWFQGFGECERVKGQLFQPRDARQEEMIAGAIMLDPNIPQKEFWLGMHNSDEQKGWDMWKWPDGKSITYRNWAINSYEPDYQNDEEWCAKATVVDNSVGWYDVSCLSLVSYICFIPKGLEGQLLSQTDDPWAMIVIPDPPRDVEAEEEVVQFLNTQAGLTFSYIRTRNSYEDSRRQCYDLGGDLAVLDTWAKERMVLGALAPHVKPSGWIEPWIGLGNPSQQNSVWNWKWINDQFPAGYYQNWASGKPTLDKRFWCGTIQFKNEDRFLMSGWVDRNCSNGWYGANDGGAICETW